MLTMEGLLAVLSFGAAMFALGYTMGSRDNDKTQKQPPRPQKTSGYSVAILSRANRLSAAPSNVVNVV